MCGHLLGDLVCTNTEPHEGNGRGCVHITGSGVASAKHEDDGGN
jgi:hypothetical protein